MNTKVILASGSIARKELLSMIIPEFEVIVSNIDEKLKEGLTPEEQVSRLANMKAKDIYENTEGNRIVIGCDTMVTKNQKIYGKPKDNVQAKQMIKELLDGDKTHKIVTGLSILIQQDGIYKEFKTFDEVKVYFSDISEEEIDKWIGTGKATTKAGAYAIQDEFGVFIEKIEGNYTTAVGIPTHKMYSIIKQYI